MIQVINRAIDILEYISNDLERPKLMSHIAEDLNLNTATCANIIKTLVNRGLIKKADHEKGYILDTGLLEIANGSFEFKDILNKAHQEMEKALNLVNENNLIAILKKNQRIVLQRKNSTQMVQALTADEKNAYDSSTGRLLIATLPDKDLQLFIKRYGLPSKTLWPGAETKAKFIEQIELIKKQGYALIEDTGQIVGIACPIYKKNKVIASFSIYMPSFRYNDLLKEKMIATAKEVAHRISEF
jgi:DNA-binding IclR family transcriptional regulator